MKHISIAIICSIGVLGPSIANAQVDKRVEVTKNYEPVVLSSIKLPITPDMTDTVKMRPDIDYGVTPSMFPTDLSTSKFRPASVTYWEFNRPTNFYVKLGAGVPLNTIADFYASSHDFRTGYIMAAANHYGQFGNLKNYFGDNRNALQAKTKATVAGGVYWGKRMFEGEVSYHDDANRRYAAPVSLFGEEDIRAEFEDFGLKMRFGDDFVDLSRMNFDVGIHGEFFHDKSYWFGDEKPKYQQFDFGVNGRLARQFGRHYLELAAGYDGYWGTKSIKDYRDNVLRIGARYGYKSDKVDLKLGADYVHDRVAARDKGSNYILPYAKLVLNVSRRESVVPFLEIDGQLHNNSFYSLALETPFLDFTDNMLSLPNTVDYNVRLGISGKFGRGRFGYRLFAELSLIDNAMLWYCNDYAWMRMIDGSEDALSLNFEINYRPINELTIAFDIHGRTYSTMPNSDYADIFGSKFHNGKSPLTASLKLRYKHSKFAIGAYGRLGVRSMWEGLSSGLSRSFEYRTPTYVDLGLDCEVKIKDDWWLFVEGTNLANVKIYNIPCYREQGIRCTAGVKFSF